VGAFEIARDCAAVSIGLRELHARRSSTAGEAAAATGVGAGAGARPAAAEAADAALARNNLGVALHGLGDAAGAMRCFREAHGILHAALGATHPRTAAARLNVGISLQKALAMPLTPRATRMTTEWRPPRPPSARPAADAKAQQKGSSKDGVKAGQGRTR
jgi:hypothetical protein